MLVGLGLGLPGTSVATTAAPLAAMSAPIAPLTATPDAPPTYVNRVYL